MSHSHKSTALIDEPPPLAVGGAGGDGTEEKTLDNLETEDGSTRQLRRNPQMTAVGRENLLQNVEASEKKCGETS